jgi:hypothetical protein
LRFQMKTSRTGLHHIRTLAKMQALLKKRRQMHLASSICV